MIRQIDASKTTQRFGILNRFDWRRVLPPILLLVILSSTALGLTDQIRQLEPWLLLSMAVLGLLVGWSIGTRRWPTWLVIALILGLGLVIDFIRVGRLGGQVSELLRSLALWQGQLPGWQPQAQLMPATLPATVTELAARLTTLIDRLNHWWVAFTQNDPIFDPVATALLWSMAIWLVSAWAGWWLRRYGRVLTSVLPAGTLLAASLFLVEAKPWALLIWLGTTLLLLSASRQTVREQRWQATGMRPPAALEAERLLTATVLSLTLVGVAALIPSVSIARITEFVNRLTDQPVTDPRPFAGSLGLRRSPEAPTPIDQARVPGLPQQQLLGSGPELSDELVMVIQVEEPADEVIDSPRYYWRSLTYDRYTGRGWWTGTPRRIEQVANEALAAPSYTARRALIQTIDVITGTNQLVYTAGTLMNINQSYVAAWRSRSDLAGIEPDDAETDLFGATIEADPYQAASQISIATENELRQAGADYPDWIRRRYLALPDELPRQIIGLARDLTATQPNPYDRAKAIEAYLRAFPYSLDLPPPPANRDMVDYFLFELKRGYCDYYASAMVILARAAGIPARLVTGYLSGTFDETTGQYLVTAADAHSWVELYFPSYGWIEFDPTARLSAIERPDAPTAETLRTELETSQNAEAEELEVEGVKPWLGLWIGLLSLISILILWPFIDRWWLHLLAPTDALGLLYRRLHRQARRLNVATQPGDTPYQFAKAFRQQLHLRSNGDQPHGELSTSLDEVDQLIDLFVQSHYSPRQPDAATTREAIRGWQRLRRRLWLARWRK